MDTQSAQAFDLDARDTTRLRVLQCIRAGGAISRTDIARDLDSSPATVTSACGALLDAGMIREVKAAPSESVQRGRPRVMLEVNADAFAVAGVKVARRAIHVMLVDFKGGEIGTYLHVLKQSCMPARALTHEVRRAVELACAQSGLDMGILAGIALGLPGFMHADSAFMHWSSSVEERNVDFRPLFQEVLPCPTFLDNDANLVAKAEHLFGAGRGLRNFLVVTIEHGVGMGIVLGGELYRGERGCGAEFGHVKVQFEGAVCQCGQRGCLEAYVGEYALIRDASVGRQSDVHKSLQDILDAARSGDALSHEVLERASQILGVALASLVNLFDPEHIVLARSRPKFDNPYTDAMLDALQRNTVQVDAPLPGITVRNLDETMWAKGAAAHGIEMVSILKIRERGAVDAA
ncbi:ROK family transcriptional regulator [Maritimibacter dapengensis]|uniref:ROK family transcriptional regulator n=1 Tax=Maritimibacter dapengensis TaxID=2836868 RepID=A0ABS6SZS0_9RHOB|nr:ROK family transcriptional regulator [Maritimibacter dapengensis]MBV7378018.1 ROK family transcriptional regulator [Maritimibacter dapengensis]